MVSILNYIIVRSLWVNYLFLGFILEVFLKYNIFKGGVGVYGVNNYVCLFMIYGGFIIKWCLFLGCIFVVFIYYYFEWWCDRCDV